jgi:hypothetical protein
MSTGQGADEYLELARLACQLPGEHDDAAIAASVLELLDRYERYRATGPRQNGPRPPGIHLIFVAAAIARMPELPLPGQHALARAPGAPRVDHSVATSR